MTRRGSLGRESGKLLPLAVPGDLDRTRELLLPLAGVFVDRWGCLVRMSNQQQPSRHILVAVFPISKHRIIPSGQDKWGPLHIVGKSGANCLILFD